MESISNFNEILKAFKIKAICQDAKQKDHYTYYDLQLLPMGKVQQIQKYGNEISRAKNSLQTKH